ncbi:hypothetical protein Lalb_Chr18g0052611 [Lupinus albus]|uniref:Uncharacterized protein n=1 Tax=Lupinus albus TaxID=3870 RepID=A0A6A4P2B5_LUPAL|nr:hypothetical protein Lalb_Chr18g0052611 [Lupinus albus]
MRYCLIRQVTLVYVTTCLGLIYRKTPSVNMRLSFNVSFIPTPSHTWVSQWGLVKEENPLGLLFLIVFRHDSLPGTQTRSLSAIG